MNKSKNLRAKIGVLFWFVLILWLIEIINLVTGYRLNNFGIYPRKLYGLYGIIFAPFLHGGLTHLLLNTIPLTIMGGIIIVRSIKEFLSISLFIILFSGIIIWFVGRPAYHVGASGLIFGYFGYLIARGWFERTVSSILIAAVILILYGGMIFYIMPSHSQVSWEAHLFGFITGIIGARIFNRKNKILENNIERG